jgi:tetratricopeptide (TPR) repeat protein
MGCFRNGGASALFFALPIVVLLAVKLITGRGTFTYYVSYPSGQLISADDQLSLSELFDQCAAKNGVTADDQIAACRTLIESGRGNNHGLSMAYYNRGNAYAQNGAIDRAIADYDQAIHHNPGMSVAFDNRGNAYPRKNDYARAITDYSETIRLNPRSAFAFNNRCWARFALGQLSDALGDCDEALRLRPDYALAYKTRGFVELKMGKPHMAGADFEAALAIHPNFATALYGRDLAKKKQGGAGDADIAAAKQLDAKVAQTFVRYGLE